jgi:hypothetical protein
VNPLRYILVLLTAFACSPGWAEQPFEKRSGEYTVYYSLFPSSFLQPDIAATYNITRGKDRLVLNISVTKGSGADSRPESALVSGTRSDLIHSQPLSFREIREKNAVYYIADVRATSRATLYFDLKVQPDPNEPPIEVRFNKEVFPE